DIFDAFTDHDRVMRWMTLGGKAIMNPRVDGLFYLDMQYQGRGFPHYGRYIRVDRPRALEFTWMSQGTQGNESVVTVELAAQRGGTALTLSHTGLPEDQVESHRGGWQELLELLEKSRQLTVDSRQSK